jgi:hypothetical protein
MNTIGSPLKVNWSSLDEVVAYADELSDDTGRFYTVYRLSSPSLRPSIYSLGLSSNEQRDVLRARNYYQIRMTVVWRKSGDHTTQPEMPNRSYYAAYTITPAVKRAIRKIRRLGTELAAANGDRNSLFYYVYGRKDMYGAIERGAFWLTTKENHKHFVRILQEEAEVREIILSGARAGATP